MKSVVWRNYWRGFGSAIALCIALAAAVVMACEPQIRRAGAQTEPSCVHVARAKWIDVYKCRDGNGGSVWVATDPNSDTVAMAR